MREYLWGFSAELDTYVTSSVPPGLPLRETLSFPQGLVLWDLAKQNVRACAAAYPPLSRATSFSRVVISCSVWVISCSRRFFSFCANATYVERILEPCNIVSVWIASKYERENWE